MDATPVPIRGKRYAPGQKPARDLRKTRGRPKRKRSLALSEIQTVDIRSDNKKQRSFDDLVKSLNNNQSSLEALPIELLEHIFDLSRNLALPAASLPLCQKLTSESLKTAVFKDNFGRRAIESADLDVVPVHYGHLYSIPDLRNQLLRLNFFTFALYEKVAECYPPLFPIINGCRPLNLHHLALVPVKFLRPPMTVDKASILNLLLRSEADIDDVHSTDYETAHDTVTQSIQEGNFKALCALLALYRYGRLEKRGVRVATEHLRVAVTEAGCDERVVLYLIASGSDSLDRNDRAIWDWIHEKKIRGDKKGDWLGYALTTDHDCADTSMRLRNGKHGVQWQSFRERGHSPKS